MHGSLLYERITRSRDSQTTRAARPAVDSLAESVADRDCSRGPHYITCRLVDAAIFGWQLNDACRFVDGRSVSRDTPTGTIALRAELAPFLPIVVWYAMYVTFQLAEVALPRRLFAAILDRITRLAIPPPSVCKCAN